MADTEEITTFAFNIGQRSATECFSCPNKIHIQVLYIFDKIAEFSDNEFARLYLTVPDDIRAKCDTYKHLIDKKLSLLGYCVLRFAMQREYGIKEFQILATANGKPFFSDANLPFFNISHCKSGVAVALHSHIIGVDIEQKDAYSDDLAQYVMSPNELDAIEHSVDKQTAFAVLWTKKEAYYKCIGTGLKDDIKYALEAVPNSMDFLTYSEHKKYVVSVCAENLDRFKSEPIKVNISDLLQ